MGFARYQSPPKRHSFPLAENDAGFYRGVSMLKATPEADSEGYVITHQKF